MLVRFHVEAEQELLEAAAWDRERSEVAERIALPHRRPGYWRHRK